MNAEQLAIEKAKIRRTQIIGVTFTALIMGILAYRDHRKKTHVATNAYEAPSASSPTRPKIKAKRISAMTSAKGSAWQVMPSGDKKDVCDTYAKAYMQTSSPQIGGLSQTSIACRACLNQATRGGAADTQKLLELAFYCMSSSQ